MADPKPQSYANHAHRPIAWNIVWLICFVALVASIWTAVRDRTLIAHVVMLIAIGVLGTVTVLRIYVLRVQDRVIRLEMRVRMTRLGLESEFEHLEHRQIIALRFASDAEMTALARRAIAEKLPPDRIKQAIVNWQGDFFRT
jgi:uncharacterized protein DUF6526